MNKILILLILFVLYSCKQENFTTEYYSNGNIKTKTEIDKNGIPNGIHEEYYDNGKLKIFTRYTNDVLLDTIYYYYETGVIKEKGLIQGKDLIGWWLYYDELGHLLRKTEYVIQENSSFLNQNIVFKENGNVDYSSSSFFELDINDTLIVGKNIGKLKYHSNPKSFDLRFIYIIIENEYPNGLIKKDTFTDSIDKLWFGIYAKEKGKLKIRGTIQEELAYTKKINKDSSEIVINRHNRYFEKEVYVKENK